MSKTIAILIARLIFAPSSSWRLSFKFFDMPSTAAYIAAAGFPFPLFLAWIAAFFELALALAFLTGLSFRAGVAAGRDLCHIPRLRLPRPRPLERNQAEFGFFIDHFTFLAGLLFAAVHGPGNALVVKIGRERSPEGQI
jgi:putative oxidoreductase